MEEVCLIIITNTAASSWYEVCINTTEKRRVANTLRFCILTWYKGTLYSRYVEKSSCITGRKCCFAVNKKYTSFFSLTIYVWLSNLKGSLMLIKYHGCKGRFRVDSRTHTLHIFHHLILALKVDDFDLRSKEDEILPFSFIQNMLYYQNYLKYP